MKTSKVLLAAGWLAAFALAGYVVLRPSPQAPPPVVVEKIVPATSPEAGAAAPEAPDDRPKPTEMPRGYHRDPEAVQAVLASLPIPYFSATPSGKMEEEKLPKYAYLWKGYEELFDKPTPLKDQNPTGSCVGFGATTAAERSLAVEIAGRVNNLDGDPSEYTDFSEEVTYAGSRVEANGGKCPIRPSRQNPAGDGSNGGWAAKFVSTIGLCPKAKYGNIDLTQYDPARARAWNYTGVPDVLEPTCNKHKVGSVARVTNWTDAKRAMANGYAIMECSDILFRGKRDAKGIAAVDPERGGHSMCLDGFHVDDDGREYGHIENSWTGRNGAPPYHTGPTGWGNPTTAGFWAKAETINTMLQQGDSWAFSSVKGFPRQDIDWFALNVPKSERDGMRLAKKSLKPFAPFTIAR